MNLPASPNTYRPARASRAGFWILAAVVAALLAGLGWGLTSYVRLGSDARALRNAVLTELEGQSVTWRRKVEASVGSVTLWVVRSGLAFVRMPEEARQGLAAARGAEVGVYELGGEARADGVGSVDAAADRAMAARGWDRIVSVRRDGDWVAVYAPRLPCGKLRACVAVLNGRNLVVAQATGRVEPLVDLIGRQAGSGWKFLEGNEEREYSPPSRRGRRG